jgi:propanol-preferring alcohol dehydrogenase
MVLEKPGKLSESSLTMRDIPVPEPKEDEVLLRVRSCGICHTDLHTIEGEISPSLPIVPGHQAVGEIIEVGSDVGKEALGTRVGTTWVRKACGTCRFCLAGKENLCETLEFNGFHKNGGYAEYMTAPYRYVYPIAEVFDDAAAAPLLCAGIIGYRSLRLSELAPGSTLALYGFGASAHLALQIAVHRGCRVFVFSRSEEHRNLARSLGACWTGTVDETVPEPISSAVTFAPVGWMVKAALKHLDRGGVLAINAIHMSPIPELEYTAVYHERTIKSVANSTGEDAVGFLKEAADIPVKVHVTQFPLGDAYKALMSVKTGTINGAAVLTDMGG